MSNIPSMSNLAAAIASTLPNAKSGPAQTSLGAFNYQWRLETMTREEYLELCSRIERIELSLEVITTILQGERENKKKINKSL